MDTKTIKLLSLPVGMDACSYYRIKKPLQGLKNSSIDCHIIEIGKEETDKLPELMQMADVIIYRQGAERGLFKIQEAIKLKAKIIVDIDDNVDNISPLSQFYKEYGTKEYTHEGLEVWKDGVKGFSIAKNVERLTYLKWGMMQADMVVVTTEKLKEYALQFNKNVYINHNSVDTSIWWKLSNKQVESLKVIWQGSPSHFEDWMTIREPLNKLMKEFNFKLYMLGSSYSGIFDDEHQDRVEVLPWVSFDAHSYRMMALQPDIALIPLAKDKFNQYKSSIKFYEMSAMGVPSVVANVLPYSEDINKTNAMPYSTPEEFYTQFKSLLENKGLRANIGNSAYQWVRKNRSLETESIRFEKRLIELCQK